MNTTTRRKKVISAILTVIMVFSMLPLSVFAADGDAVADVTVNGKTTEYTDIDAAFAAAQEADSATVKLLADADIDGMYVSLGNFDLTVDLNGHTFGHAGQQFELEFYNAGTSKLTVTGAGSFLSPILVGTNGHLTVEADVGYIKGVKISFSGGDSPTNWSVALKGGKYGEIDMRYTDKDGATQNAGYCGDLLVPGYVFSPKINSETSATDVEVKPCSGHSWSAGSCDYCNLPCPHNWVDSKCTVCGYGCAHSSVEERDGNTYCSEMCGQQMVVKVEKDGKTTYYAEKHNAYNDETLWWLFNKALESGSTVTLLADNLCAWAYVSGGKQITLDLNGKTLIETFQGITVGQGSREDTSTDNKLIVKGALGASEAAEADSYAFRTWEGGELNLEDFEGGGKIGGIIADGGKVTTGVSNADIKIGTLYINDGNTQLSFRAGTFDKICFSSTGGGQRKAGRVAGKELRLCF